MIYVTGDVHCPYDVHKLNKKNFPEQVSMTKDDVLIVTGDMGIVWSFPESKYYKEDLYWQKWFKNKKFTTLFVDGNHENFEMLKTFPTVEKFGGKVDVIADNVYHLRRGEIYTIQGKTFFCFGGASSHDKEHRIIGVSWWADELPTNEEMDYGLINLEKYDYKVDYIISHCCSQGIQKLISVDYSDDCLTKYFQYLEESVKFEHWYFGHYHIDKDLSYKHTCLYEKKVRIV